MKMKKENMDHIRERFENETGVKLPEKESFEMPAWTGRIVAAAAGLICLVGLGLVWHKVSLDKQVSAEMMLTDGEEGYEVSPEYIEETEEGDFNPEDALISDSDEVSSDSNSITIESNDDKLSVSGEISGKAFETSIWVKSCDGIQLFLFKKPKDIPDDAAGNVDLKPLVYPVPSDIDRMHVITDDPDKSTCTLSIFCDNYQLPEDCLCLGLC